MLGPKGDEQEGPGAREAEGQYKGVERGAPIFECLLQRGALGCPKKHKSRIFGHMIYHIYTLYRVKHISDKENKEIF